MTIERERELIRRAVEQQLADERRRDKLDRDSSPMPSRAGAVADWARRRSKGPGAISP